MEKNWIHLMCLCQQQHRRPKSVKGQKKIMYKKFNKKSPICSNFFPEINKQLDNTPLYYIPTTST